MVRRLHVDVRLATQVLVLQVAVVTLTLGIADGLLAFMSHERLASQYETRSLDMARAIAFAPLVRADVAAYDAAPPQPEPPSVEELVTATPDEVIIGEQTLSRGLYELYIAESRQLLDKLLDQHTRLETNPLRVPTIDAIRAAHTLAGISGTARIEPAYALGKALEHALHRFTDTDTPPEAAQTDVLGTAVLTLKNLPASMLTSSDSNKALAVTCSIKMVTILLGDITTSSKMSNLVLL